MFYRKYYSPKIYSFLEPLTTIFYDCLHKLHLYGTYRILWRFYQQRQIVSREVISLSFFFNFYSKFRFFSYFNLAFFYFRHYSISFGPYSISVSVYFPHFRSAFLLSRSFFKLFLEMNFLRIVLLFVFRNNLFRSVFGVIHLDWCRYFYGQGIYKPECKFFLPNEILGNLLSL